MKSLIKVLGLSILASLVIVGFSCKKNENPPPSDYFSYSGHSYQIVKSKKTWVDAAADAVAKGGYLVEIGSKEEQDAVYQGILTAEISSTYTNVTDGGGVAYIWIGATDRAKEDSWIWNGANASSGTLPLFWYGDNTGSAVGGSFVNWGGKAAGKFNEPDNFTDSEYSPKGQNTAAIGLAKWPAGATDGLGKAGEWNDIAETNMLYYIVEFDTIKE